MSRNPKFSFVAASRNDDHGGNLRHRMQVFIEALGAQCARHNLDAELVLVEWNPPEDRPGLEDALDWSRTEGLPVRIIRVPGTLHRKFENASTLPLHQMIAKNVGIRRARGAFVVATNIDIVFSDELMRFLSSADLDPSAFYRTNRHDVNSGIPESVGVRKQLEYCRKHTLRIHKREGTLDLNDGSFNRIYRSPVTLAFITFLEPLAFLPLIGERIRNASRASTFIERFGRLHTNACGDFTMMARDQWHRLEGYWEFSGFPAYVDGVLCHAASFSGLREYMLPETAPVFHIEHGTGTGYKAYETGTKWADLDSNNIPRIDRESYTSILETLKSGGRIVTHSEEPWGLGDHRLEEIEF